MEAIGDTVPLSKGTKHPGSLRDASWRVQALLCPLVRRIRKAGFAARLGVALRAEGIARACGVGCAMLRVRSGPKCKGGGFETEAQTETSPPLVAFGYTGEHREA